MRVAARLFLSLLICLVLPMHAGAASPTKNPCLGMQMSTTDSTASTPDCSPMGDSHAQPMGAMCKAGAACSLTVPAFNGQVGLAIAPIPGSNYPPTSVHFILQDFSRTLLRPPSLG